MKTKPFRLGGTLALIGFAVMATLTVAAAQNAVEHRSKSQQEHKLLAVLQSNAPLFDKARACEQLAVVGSTNSVPVLAALLEDPGLSDYARFALEPIDNPAVDAVLRAALGRLQGKQLVGVINSLGVRRDAQAVGALEKLARAPARGVGAEALAALGRIASADAIRVLHQALSNGPASLRTAAADACLNAAQRLMQNRQSREAVRLFDLVRQAALPERLRASAVYGAILARGSDGVSLLVDQLNAGQPARVQIALQAARQLPGATVSRKLAAELGKLPPEIQALMIPALADRGDAEASDAMAELATSQTPAVRLAALKALGRIGNASAVPVLLRALAAGGAEAETAQASLQLVQSPDADAAILNGLESARGNARVKLIRVLEKRRSAAAVPSLLEAAAGEDSEVAIAAFEALAVLAQPDDLPALVTRLIAVNNAAVGSEAETALVRVTDKIPDPNARAAAVVAALPKATRPAARAALIRVLGKIGGPKAYAAVADALHANDPQIQDAAIRSLAAWPDLQAQPALLDLARNASNNTHRRLALRGYVRLLGQAAERDPDQAVGQYRQAMELAHQPEAKKLVLSGLARVAHPQALAIALAHRDDPAVRDEADLAAIGVARLILGADRQVARAALNKILTGSHNESITGQARQLLQTIEQFGDSITAWRVAGPYAEEGRNYRQLFDIPFAPEKTGAENIDWRLLPAGTDPKRPRILDLLGAIGGEQRVAYARTWVHSDAVQSARLELGTDDGVKAWLNGQLVHANNVARAAIPYTDKTDVTLKAGWNSLLLKITQNDSPWEFCARLCRRDGQPLDGLRFNCRHDPP